MTVEVRVAVADGDAEWATSHRDEIVRFASVRAAEERVNDGRRDEVSDAQRRAIRLRIRQQHLLPRTPQEQETLDAARRDRLSEWGHPDRSAAEVQASLRLVSVAAQSALLATDLGAEIATFEPHV